MNRSPAASSAPSGRLTALGLLLLVLGILFCRSFNPDLVHFNNDGPLGIQMNQCAQPPGAFTGVWFDSGFLGGNGGAWPIGANILIRWLLGPVGYSKFLPPAALLILGLGAWTFFRQLKLTPLAATLGALAAMLNSNFFSSACWGVASQEIAIGMDFLALALIVGSTAETPAAVRWIRLALAGLCVGMNVMEAADIGALFSLLIAAFVFFKSFSEETGPALKKLARGAVRVAVVAGFAGFIALQTVLSLVTTQIQGIAGTGQDTESKAANWDRATQWSLPKAETFGIIVPGLFGYKMDTSRDMLPAVQDAYRNGVYWGGVGRAPELDRYYDGGSQGPPPENGFMRFTGSGYYCGILVLLVAAWAVARSFRPQNPAFTDAQRRMIWFWAFIALVSLPVAWGRFAPFSKTSDSPLFYALLYKLPYFSTIRNPTKFLFFLSWGTVILFGYGIHALNRRYLDRTAPAAAGLGAQWKIWWAKAGGFDRRWTYATAGLFGAGLLAWMIYAAQKPELIQYLQKVGFADTDPAHDNSAASIAAFSLAQLGWFLLLLAGAVALLLGVIAGYFNGPRARLGAILLGAFLLFDLGRANLPWITHWDYKLKYEVGSLNPVVDFLAKKPWENRVAYGVPRPLSTPEPFMPFKQLYDIEWMQHHFPYYNIQSLDVVQLPRMPEDMKAYEEALQLRIRPAADGRYEIDPASFPLVARRWQLTNTRYLLAPAGFLDQMNQQFDPAQKRFRFLQRFSIALKPGVTEFHQRLEELTVYPKSDGEYALIEFTGALPRAKLYSNWQVSTNDAANLKTLADLNFDPAKTVLISTPQPNLPARATNENTGTVECRSYAPKHIVLAAAAAAPSVLLLNDKYDPNWRVTVDGHPAELLRCNFFMRGVQLEPGTHTVTFDFSLPNKPFYVTLSALGLGLLLCAALLLLTRRHRAARG